MVFSGPVQYYSTPYLVVKKGMVMNQGNESPTEIEEYYKGALNAVRARVVRIVQEEGAKPYPMQNNEDWIDKDLIDFLKRKLDEAQNEMSSIPPVEENMKDVVQKALDVVVEAKTARARNALFNLAAAVTILAEGL